MRFAIALLGAPLLVACTDLPDGNLPDLNSGADLSYPVLVPLSEILAANDRRQPDPQDQKAFEDRLDALRLRANILRSQANDPDLLRARLRAG